ncbi:MAG: hypothetical protein M0C28_05940 [Candidatus Moduliflexus flocculans]|nr:hypothetical protein [Candidatus Moduliflexus flocculans]
MLFGVGIDEHIMPEALHFDALHEIRGIGDGHSASGLQDIQDRLRQVLRDCQLQLDVVMVREMHVNVPHLVGYVPRVLVEVFPGPVEGFQDMLAGSQGVLAEVRARAVGIPLSNPAARHGTSSRKPGS